MGTRGPALCRRVCIPQRHAVVLIFLFRGCKYVYQILALLLPCFSQLGVHGREIYDNAVRKTLYGSIDHVEWARIALHIPDSHEFAPYPSVGSIRNSDKYQGELVKFTKLAVVL